MTPAEVAEVAEVAAMRAVAVAAPARPSQAAWRAITPAKLLAMSVVLAAAFLSAQLHPYLGDYGDDAEFLVLGQGLARGQGYAWVNSPDQPAHNRYPPGYPVLLAATMLATGTSGDPLFAIMPAKLVTAATFLGSLGLLWLLARRRLPPAWAAGAVSLYALNPFAIRFAVQVMSDVPYILAELGALAWADRLAGVRGERREAWRWALLGVLLAAGAYVRSAGLMAAVGVLAWAWWRERRAALLATGAFVTLMLPWWLRDATLAGGWRYVEELLAARYQDPAAGTVTAADMLTRAIGNTTFVLGKPGIFGVAGFLAGAALGALIALGFWHNVRSGAGAAEWVVVPLTLAVLVWPIKTGRYLLPILPIVGIYAAGGLFVLSRWWAARPPAAVRPHSRFPVMIAGSVLLAVVAFECLYAARTSAANVRAVAGASGPAAYYRERAEWAHYLQAAAWLREHADGGDVAMARRHFALYVYSGRHTEKYRFETTPDELSYLTVGTMRKFVVEDAFDYLRGDFPSLPVALRARGGDLLLRFETPMPAVRVWELVRPPQP